MNDVTPRRLTGSLIERANERFAFTPARTEIKHPRDVPPPARERELPPTPLSASVPPRMAEDQPRRSRVEAPTATKADAAPTRPRRAAPAREGSVDRRRLAEAGMIVPGAAATGLAEEFRIVKRALLHSLGEAPISRRILVSSAQPAEGKSFSAVNLALSIAAEKDVEVVLIDADFAKAEVPRLLGLEAGEGLLDAIADPALDPETLLIRTDVPQLSVLPAGTRTNEDTELLASDRTSQLLDALQAADPRRILIFDSPPALAASPASTLAHQVGHVLLVVRADVTAENEVREAVMLLDGCDDIQLMLNRARFSPGGKRFGTYYGYGA